MEHAGGRAESAQEVHDIVSLARTRVSSSDPRERDAAGYGLMVRFARWAQPGYVATKSGKSWFDDVEFFQTYDRLVPGDYRRSAERSRRRRPRRS